MSAELLMLLSAWPTCQMSPRRKAVQHFIPDAMLSIGTAEVIAAVMALHWQQLVALCHEGRTRYDAVGVVTHQPRPVLCKPFAACDMHADFRPCGMLVCCVWLSCQTNTWQHMDQVRPATAVVSVSKLQPMQGQ